jgi:outer membrane protein assembly complex protein YaeT
VIFEVEESPVVRQISISGNESVESDKIRDILTLTTGSTLDPPLLFENRARIEALYRAEGFFLAEVEFQIESIGEASVGIHFEVTENEKLRLKKIVFTGNQHFSGRELRAGFQTKTWRFWSYATSWFDRSGTYSEPLFIQDLRAVEKRYTDSGFLRVEMGKPDVVPSEGGLVVTVSIQEGPRFRAGTIGVSGDATVDIGTLREKLNLKEGDIFNRSYLTEDISQLTEHYTDRGFYFASVTPRTRLSEEEGTVDVVFEVRKGPLYFIRRVDVVGNTVTVDSVVRREIPIVEGQLYSQRAILLARERVRRLGFFEEVEFDMKPTDEPEQLDLEVSVVERPTGSFSFGAGYSSQDNFVFMGSLSQSNLFGRGYAAQMSAQLGGETQSFFLSFSDPRAFGTDFSLGTTIFRTTSNFEDFEQEQIGADLALGHALTEDNTSRGFLRYSFASREIVESNNVNAAAVIFRELMQDSLTSSLVGVSYSADTRDDRLAPTEGHQLGATLEYSGLGFFSRFLRFEARGAWFLGAPRWLFDRSTFVASTRLGYTVPFNDIGDWDFPPSANVPHDSSVRPLDEIDTDIVLPLSERYFLGGLGTFQLRGFKSRSVGPRRAILYQGAPGLYLPLGRDLFVRGSDGQLRLFDGTFNPGDELTALCVDTDGNIIQDSACNSIDDDDIDDFANLDLTDVIGGSSFISSSLEYRFPISEAIGLQGVLFFDTGNAFAEGENLFDVTEWRYGTGVGVQWFSPFGPLALILGFPLDALEDEKSPVFEFSIGGAGF